MTQVVCNHPDYIITDSGKVFKQTKDGLREVCINMSNGHARVTIDGENYYIGKLVLEHFDEKPGGEFKVFNIDGDYTNNCLSNLCWLSPSDIQLYSHYKIEYRKQVLSRARD